IELIHDLTTAHGLKIPVMNGHASIEAGMNEPDQHLRILKELEKNLRIARKNDIHGLICFAGSISAERSTAESIQNCVNCLTEIAPMAEDLGVLLNLELLNSVVDHPGYECDNTAFGVEVVTRVNSPAVKLLFDIYHMQIMEGNIISHLIENIDWIGHIHTAGVPGRFDFDDQQEINYRGIMKAISKANYAHYVGHEFKPKLAYLDSLTKAYNICNQ
ncbi:MAG: TIM barrel protein, partial [Anaerolineae bacterium]|nr:TIM barrel protein [Anaerolineae bacterium]